MYSTFVPREQLLVVNILQLVVGTIEHVVYNDVPNEYSYLVRLLQSLGLLDSNVPLHIPADHTLQQSALELDKR